jgi:hypothetical protein
MRVVLANVGIIGSLHGGFVKAAQFDFITDVLRVVACRFL